MLAGSPTVLSGEVPPTRGAVPRWRGLGILLLTAIAVFAVDHATKWLVVQHLALNDEFPDGGAITIHRVQNRGAAFGLFPQLQALFLVAAVVVSAYILVVGRRHAEGWIRQVMLGLVLGGAAANAVDRLFQGYVVDFIDLHRWPVFNVADMAIVVGILAGVGWVWFSPSQRKFDVGSS